MTCAAHVQRIGQGFPGQLGVFSDDHLPGLTRLAAKIKAEGAVSSVQLHHAGIRSPEALIGETAGRAQRGRRDRRAGALHRRGRAADRGLHRRGGARRAGRLRRRRAARRPRLHPLRLPQPRDQPARPTATAARRRTGRGIVFDIIKGVRARTRPDFQLGLRLSPERFGLRFAEQLRAGRRRCWPRGDLDYLDMSLWDVFKAPVEEDFASRPLIDWFAELPRGETRLGAAGKLMSGADMPPPRWTHGADFAILGRAGDPAPRLSRKRFAADPDFHPDRPAGDPRLPARPRAWRRSSSST